MAGRQIDGIALGCMAAGGFLVYAGIKGKSTPSLITGFIQGKSPAAAAAANPITPGAAAAGAPALTTTASQTAATAAPVSESDWIKAVLSGIGAPDTAANISSMESWIGHEGSYGTQGANNPLNSELPIAGSTSFDGAVQNYPTPADGISATVETLESGPYEDILMLLQSGNGLCGQSLQGLSAWSGGGYSEVC